METDIKALRYNNSKFESASFSCFSFGLTNTCNHSLLGVQMGSSVISLQSFVSMQLLALFGGEDGFELISKCCCVQLVGPVRCFFGSRVHLIMGVYTAKGKQDPDFMQVLSFYGNSDSASLKSFEYEDRQWLAISIYVFFCFCF